MSTTATDEQLLTSRDPEAFGVFYARHLPAVEAYFRRELGDREAAADLAAETFASALVARRRFVPGPVPAAGWLHTIAQRRRVDFLRRAATRRRLEDVLTHEALVSTDEALPAAQETDCSLLRHLPPGHRDAIRAHTLEGRDYGEIATATGTSEATVRQRVSRGLRALRPPLLAYRSAQELARQDHAYRFAGGHRTFLSAVGPRDALDCSGAASLVLHRAGLLDSDTAWTSGRFARDWGEEGEGDLLTLWADDHHVWIEFKLGVDHHERFDPTPRLRSPGTPWLTRQPIPSRGCVPRRLAGV